MIYKKRNQKKEIGATLKMLEDLKNINIDTEKKSSKNKLK